MVTWYDLFFASVISSVLLIGILMTISNGFVEVLKELRKKS